MMRLKIDNETLAQEFFENCRIIGIVAPVKDYNFIWYVNNYLGFDFRAQPQLEIQLIKKKRHYFFSVFQYNVPSNCMVHYLYNNEFDGEYLLPEFKHLDFVWLIKEEFISNEDLNLLMQSLKKVPDVQLVSEMTADKIKHKQHLIL